MDAIVRILRVHRSSFNKPARGQYFRGAMPQVAIASTGLVEHDNVETHIETERGAWPIGLRPTDPRARW
jgi:hypothetical protein